MDAENMRVVSGEEADGDRDVAAAAALNDVGELECPVFLQKSGSSLQPRVCCTLVAPAASITALDHAIKFSAAHLAKSTDVAVHEPADRLPDVPPRAR